MNTFGASSVLLVDTKTPIATGLISSWFVEDLLKPDWPEKSANHIIQAIGSSSLDKCHDFYEKHVAPAKPKKPPELYDAYSPVYEDPSVDVVYIGTPHSFHKQNCLDAIRAGKNILCEKPFTMNAKEAEEVFTAAREKGVFIMEAMWTRFYPLMKTVQKVLHEEKKLGTIHRTFCDFGLDIDIPSKPPTSRYRDPALGAGSLLDIGKQQRPHVQGGRAKLHHSKGLLLTSEFRNIQYHMGALHSF